MQPSNEQPSEMDEQQVKPLSEQIVAEEGAFYEFPAEPPAQQSKPAPAEPEADSSRNVAPIEASAQEIQAGLVYPPPPSFYQSMQIPAEKPSLPSPAPGPLSGPSPYAQTFAPAPAFVQQMNYQPRPDMPLQPFPGAVPPAPARRSRKTLWIVLSIVGVLLLLICGLCSWSAYSFLGPIFSDATAVTNVVTNYYQNLEQDNYDAAYTSLQISNLTQADFTQQAQQREADLGSINSFSVASASADVTSSNNGAQISGYAIGVSVVRGTNRYTAHLDLQKLGGNWRITQLDVI
jgi:hypothetical protein